MKLSYKILAGMIAGVVVGFATGPLQLQWIYAWIAPLGTLFINMIRMIIIPVAFASLVVGAAAIGDVRKLGIVGEKILGYYILTTVSAVSLGVFLGDVMQPGKKLSLTLGSGESLRALPFSPDVWVNQVPNNPFRAMVDANVLQVMVFALLVGVAIALVGDRARTVSDFFEGMVAVTNKIIDFIMEMAPYAVFVLMAQVVVDNGLKILLPLGTVIVAVYVGCILHMAVVYSGVVSILGGMNPVAFFRGILPAILVAFSTCSSNAAFHVNMQCARDNLGVKDEVTEKCLPLGAVVNMDGTALYQGVCALFVAQAYGIELHFGHYLMIVVTGTLASIGTAGIPGAGLVMLALILQSIGLPLEGIALIVGIDRILDMIRSAVNVTGDSAACVYIQGIEEQRDTEKK